MLKHFYLLFVIWILTISSVQAKTYIRDYTYNASDVDSKITSRINALDSVKTLLLQEIGTHIRNEIRITKDGRGNTFASEDVEAITAGLTKVEIIEEKWNGETYYLKVKIEANTDDVLTMLEAIKKEKSNDSMLRLKKLKDNQHKLNLARKEVIQLKNKLSKFTSDAEKEQIIDEYIRQVEQISLYDMYENGYNYSKRGQFEDAVFWFQKAAERGNAQAQSDLGYMYYTGKGVKQDTDEAVYWYKKSAEQGNLDAYNNLGIANRTGKYWPIEETISWYKKAAEQGHADAQYNLGVMYSRSYLIPHDFKLAIYWYKKSAEQGHAGAQNYLGHMFYKGKNVDKDYVQAAHWYEKSAKRGDMIGQYHIGEMYYTGKGVKKNYTQAIYWFKKSAEQGYYISQNILGFMYYSGQGVKKDYSEAITWYKKSAEQGGYAEAQYNLGYMYKKGQGVHQDAELAKKLYRQACESGYKPACSNI